jgi:vitamin B12/bleomycin/antimicrobial peptide transport system ATP-binding/permease protein
VITQSAIAFTQLLGAFSIIVTQFQSISSYTAVLARLGSLIEAGEREKLKVLSDTSFSIGEKQISYQGLTLRSPRSGRVLIKKLNCAIPCGTRVLVRGEDETARSALFHGTAGLWDVGEGHIVRPRLEQILLLPELPYLPPGTIRELLLRPWPEEEQATERSLEAIQVSEVCIVDTLHTLKIESLLAGFGGLDTRHHWENTLPLEDQQLLVFARILLAKPDFVFLDRPSTTLNPEQIDWILGLLSERGITYVTFENVEHPVYLARYDAVLDLQEGGAWAFEPVKNATIVEEGLPAAG